MTMYEIYEKLRDAKVIYHNEDMRQELHAMTDAELITVFNRFVEGME